MGVTMNPEDAAAEATSGDGGEVQPVFRRAVQPGTVLREELAALGISLATFARQLAVPTSDLSRIVKSQRQLTARMALRLGHWFGMEPEFWLNLQAQYDLAQVERESGEAMRRLPPRRPRCRRPSDGDGRPWAKP